MCELSASSLTISMVCIRVRGVSYRVFCDVFASVSVVWFGFSLVALSHESSGTTSVVLGPSVVSGHRSSHGLS